jgi:hypothetical protein
MLAAVAVPQILRMRLVLAEMAVAVLEVTQVLVELLER